jgi:3-oxoacyl-[acyl-carrier-protein] synthase II
VTAVAITGVGAVTALGSGAQVLHDRTVRGDSGIVDGIAACRDFDPLGVLDNWELRRTDRHSQLALVAADEAARQAGWADHLPYPPAQVTCVMGTALGSIGTMEAEVGTLRRDGELSVFVAPQLLAGSSGLVAMRYGLNGESWDVASACSGGATSIGAGLRAIRSGAAVAALVGGAESPTSPFTRAFFAASGALSRSGRSVPFDRDRDGFILGEGAGVLILENMDAAQDRGATVLGQVLGFGATTYSERLVGPEPIGAEAARAVMLACRDAGVAAEDIDYINAHGNATINNDRDEAEVLQMALGDAAAKIPVSSTKSSIGHLLGACGAVEAVATLLALRYGVAPPIVGLENPDEKLGPLACVRQALPLPDRPAGRIGLSTTFAFGGHNSAVVLSA